MVEITVYVMLSYFTAYVCKTAGVKKKWLPVVSASTGLICGVVGYVIGYAGRDIFDALGTGIFSGFSAVGTNEIAKYIFVRRD